MNPNSRFLRPAFPAFLALAALLPGLLHAAEEEDPMVARLREALRTTMLQLRDSQNQAATLQAQQVESEKKVRELNEKIDALNKQAVADRNTSANMIAELQTRLDEQKTVIISSQAALEKWKKSYAEVTALAQRKEAERAKLEAQKIKLDRQVQEQEVINLKMFKLSMEVLDRYERFGLGDALLAREPFVGNTRVKFQTLIQDYQDKLTDSRIKPAESPAPRESPQHSQKKTTP